MTRRLIGTAVTTLLVVAAVGLLSWFAFSHFANATLITFRTGSMSPTMPQGSMAVTLPTAAADLEPGDVITIQRVTEDMPVTHRVIEVREATPREPHTADVRAAAPDGRPPEFTEPGQPIDPAARELVLQGDDNDQPDSLPYVANDARKVVFSAPYVGNALMLIQTPLGMGILILGVGALVTWAFWPSRSEPSGEAGIDSSPDDGTETSTEAAGPPESSASAQHPHLTKS